MTVASPTRLRRVLAHASAVLCAAFLLQAPLAQADACSDWDTCSKTTYPDAVRDAKGEDCVRKPGGPACTKVPTLDKVCGRKPMCAVATPPPPPPSSGGSPASGPDAASVYARDCKVCHGADGKGKFPFTFTKTDAEMIKIIKEGTKSKDGKVTQKGFPDLNATAMVEFIKTLKK